MQTDVTLFKAPSGEISAIKAPGSVFINSPFPVARLPKTPAATIEPEGDNANPFIRSLSALPVVRSQSTEPSLDYFRKKISPPPFTSPPPLKRNSLPDSSLAPEL